MSHDNSFGEQGVHYKVFHKLNFKFLLACRPEYQRSNHMF